jgi:hypothetical protein
MSKDAMLPCIVCGRTLKNTFPDQNINQPSEGTEFQTYGHYGSTFWDSFQAEQIIINVCDDCLRERSDRIGRRKRYVDVVVKGKAIGVVGWKRVDHEMVPYFDGPEDDTQIVIKPEQIGDPAVGVNVKWIPNWEQIKDAMLKA